MNKEEVQNGHHYCVIHLLLEWLYLEQLCSQLVVLGRYDSYITSCYYRIYLPINDTFFISETMLQSGTIMFEVVIVKFEEMELEFTIFVEVQTSTKQYVHI